MMPLASLGPAPRRRDIRYAALGGEFGEGGLPAKALGCTAASLRMLLHSLMVWSRLVNRLPRAAVLIQRLSSQIWMASAFRSAPLRLFCQVAQIWQPALRGRWVAGNRRRMRSSFPLVPPVPIQRSSANTRTGPSNPESINGVSFVSFLILVRVNLFSGGRD